MDDGRRDRGNSDIVPGTISGQSSIHGLSDGTEMVVARASTLRCIRPASLSATGAADVVVASCAGTISGSSEGRNRFERPILIGGQKDCTLIWLL